jgi:hypothetical protein
MNPLLGQLYPLDVLNVLYSRTQSQYVIRVQIFLGSFCNFLPRDLNSFLSRRQLFDIQGFLGYKERYKTTKNSKKEGTDLILNEFIKTGNSTLILTLVKLFIYNIQPTQIQKLNLMTQFVSFLSSLKTAKIV